MTVGRRIERKRKRRKEPSDLVGKFSKLTAV